MLKQDYIRDGGAIYDTPSRSSAPRPTCRASRSRKPSRRAHDPCLRHGRRCRAIVAAPGFVPAARAALDAAPRSSATRRWSPTASPGHGCRPTTTSSARCAMRGCRRPPRARHYALGRRARPLARAAAGAVVVIGNAPTALFRLLELLDAGAPPPAAIFGMPVGFVGAAESKDALAAMRTACPTSSCAAAWAAAPWPPPRSTRSPRRAYDGRLIGVGRRPRRSRAADAQGDRALHEADVVAHFAKRGTRATPGPSSPPISTARRAAAALSRDHRNRERGRCLSRRDQRVLRRVRGGGRQHLDAGRTVAVLSEGDPLFYGSYMHLHVRLSPALSDRGHPRRHRHVRLLVGDRHADGPRRRCVHRAARHAAGIRAGAPARRYRRRRGHEARPASAKVRRALDRGRAARPRHLCRTRHHGERGGDAARRQARRVRALFRGRAGAGLGERP